MKLKAGQYIVYINEEYFRLLCKQRLVITKEERDQLYEKLTNEIGEFIKSEATVSVLYSTVFTDNEGKRRKAIQISPILSAGNPKSLHYIRKINKRRKL